MKHPGILQLEAAIQRHLDYIAVCRQKKAQGIYGSISADVGMAEYYIEKLQEEINELSKEQG